MSPLSQRAYSKIGLLAEASWEVCNKIGGIYTVLSTKARVLQEKYGDKLVFIGPDVWTKEKPSSVFKENKSLFNKFSSVKIGKYDISVRTGHWKVPGSPQVILVKFDGVYAHLNHIFGRMWEEYGVDSMHEYGDYREGCAFSIAVAEVICSLASHLGISSKAVTAHFNEWTTGMGLLWLRSIMPEASTLFTTHATSIGRSICGNGKPLYDYFSDYNGDQMARELNMEAKHSLEKHTALNADCFTAVSELTAREAEQLLGIRPQVVTPNGFEPDFVPGDKKYKTLRKKGREKLLDIAGRLKDREFQKDCLIVATSGRNEYRNKGIDLFLDALTELERKYPEKEVLALILVPAWVSHPSPDLDKWPETKADPDYITHILHNMDSDQISNRVASLEREAVLGKNVSVVYVPCYLDGADGVVNISYYDLLPAIDITVFASYYEPWGYTPLESVAFGIPTVTTDKSGFGQWVLANLKDSIMESGVKVIARNDSNYHLSAELIAEALKQYAAADAEERETAIKAAAATAEKADWKYFISFYYDAFDVASMRRDERLKN